MSTMTSGVYKTDDMALVTYLSVNGYSPQSIERDAERVVPQGHNKMLWVFSINDDIQDLIDTYDDGEASVEPRRFVIAMRRVREEMLRVANAAGRN